MNPWPLESLASLLTESPRNGVSPSDGGTVRSSVLTLSAITGAAFNESASKEADFKVNPPTSKRVDHRDFLVCRGNGNLRLVGSGFFPKRDLPGVVFPDTMIALRVDSSRVDREYLEFVWRSQELRGQIEAGARTTNGTFKINQGVVEGLRIPVPPIGEQRRIAAVLRNADELRAKRRQAISLLDALVQSIFLDRFGRDSKDGTIVTVEEVAAQKKNAIRTGPFGSQLLHEEFTDTGIPVLGIDNAVQNEFRWARPRFISDEKYRQLKRYRVFPGDVLITIMGTCGRCAVAPADMPESINTKHLCCITLDRSKCLPDFLHDYFLMHPVAQNYLQRTAKGAIMSGLNMGIIKALPIALPPLAQQELYVETMRGVHEQELRSKRHLEQLDELFNSLQARAFRGEL